MVSSSDYISLRGRAREPSVSPSCRPMAMRKPPEDIFLQSPFKSPPPMSRPYSHYQPTSRPMLIDDDEGNIFLTASSPAMPMLPLSPSRPLRTPVKEVHRVRSRPALAVKEMNTPASAHIDPVNGVGLGAKRKSTANGAIFSTPLRQRATTPLSLSAVKATENAPGSVTFHRLAPLPTPRFVTRTPQTKAETEAYVKRQAETMRKLRIRDLENSDDGWGVVDEARSDDEIEGQDDDRGAEVATQKAKGKEEVVEVVSPDGHIIKRRARSRPVSLELLESIHNTPSPPASNQTDRGRRPIVIGGTVLFPSVPHIRSNSPSPSSSETGSPFPRRRLTGSSGLHAFSQSRSSDSITQRAPISRLASSGSATLFFGPAIDPPNINVTQHGSTKLRPRTSTAGSRDDASALSVVQRVYNSTRPKMQNRHSYAGPVAESKAVFPWMARSSVMDSSPDSSPRSLPRGGDETADEDEIMFFSAAGPAPSPFVLSVTAGTPSPRSKQTGALQMLSKKFKPRDSGCVLSDDESYANGVVRDSRQYLTVLPQASASVGSINSDTGDELVTPGFAPGPTSGWPGAVFVSSGDDNERSFEHSADEADNDVDAFILRTLATGGKGSAQDTKKPPGTPVKKSKISYLGGDRPWQSAVAARVGFDFDIGSGKKKGGKPAPRKSLPAAFPILGSSSKRSKLTLNGSDTEEDEENSPSLRKENKYEGLGLGRPPVPSRPAGGPISRTRWLIRRSSSGAFSSGSEASCGTPTRLKDFRLVPPRDSGVTSHTTSKVTNRVPSGSQSSATSSSTCNTPTVANSRRLPISGPMPIEKRSHASPFVRKPSPVGPEEHEQLGRFERDFVEVDLVGTGEFGKVIKVRRKNGPEDEVYAVKRSKRFEGQRHRLRLREEVEILQHLAAVARSRGHQGGQHPNVLSYIDSWEQDEALYIMTELCELGNFARFLGEYGRMFPRLDEARVWKIFVDLSSGLRFVHEAGVIHLDLKPANIFVTREGRFKIGDFGMASLWPRRNHSGPQGVPVGGFEREGDKVYLAPEVLQGRYGKAADIFSLGMTMLETASNIVVPDQGESWHRLRREDFSQVDWDASPELLDLIKSMMRTEPALRVGIQTICAHPVLARTRAAMERKSAAAQASKGSIFAASPLASIPDTFLEEILGRPVWTGNTSHTPMDLSL